MLAFQPTSLADSAFYALLRPGSTKAESCAISKKLEVSGRNSLSGSQRSAFREAQLPVGPTALALTIHGRTKGGSSN
jgi:hypothetical protein